MMMMMFRSDENVLWTGCVYIFNLNSVEPTCFAFGSTDLLFANQSGDQAFGWCATGDLISFIRSYDDLSIYNLYSTNIFNITETGSSGSGSFEVISSHQEQQRIHKCTVDLLYVSISTKIALPSFIHLLFIQICIRFSR